MSEGGSVMVIQYLQKVAMMTFHWMMTSLCSPVREESVVDAAPLLLHLADPARVFELSFQLSHPRLFFSKPFSSKGDLVKNGFGTYVAI